MLIWLVGQSENGATPCGKRSLDPLATALVQLFSLELPFFDNDNCLSSERPLLLSTSKSGRNLSWNFVRIFYGYPLGTAGTRLFFLSRWFFLNFIIKSSVHRCSRQDSKCMCHSSLYCHMYTKQGNDSAFCTYCMSLACVFILNNKSSPNVHLCNWFFALNQVQPRPSYQRLFFVHPSAFYFNWNAHNRQYVLSLWISSSTRLQIPICFWEKPIGGLLIYEHLHDRTPVILACIAENAVLRVRIVGNGLQVQGSLILLGSPAPHIT